MDDPTTGAVAAITSTQWGAIAIGAVAVIGMIIKLVQPTQSAIRDWVLGQRRTAAEVREHDTAQLQAEIERLAALVSTLQDTIDAMQRRERARERAIIRHIQWDHDMIQAAIRSGHNIIEPPDLWGITNGETP